MKRGPSFQSSYPCPPETGSQSFSISGRTITPSSLFGLVALYTPHTLCVPRHSRCLCCRLSACSHQGSWTSFHFEITAQHVFKAIFNQGESTELAFLTSTLPLFMQRLWDSLFTKSLVLHFRASGEQCLREERMLPCLLPAAIFSKSICFEQSASETSFCDVQTRGGWG